MRVDGSRTQSAKKKLRVQKYPDTCGRAPRILLTDNIQSGGSCSVNYFSSNFSVTYCDE